MNPRFVLKGTVALLIASSIHSFTFAQVDPVLQQENISGFNNVNKLKTLLDWAGLINSSSIPTVGAVTNNGQIITTTATGFQYQVTYVKELGYTSLGSGTSAFKYDYSTSASYGTGKPKQAALAYGAVCSSLQVAGSGSYRMEVNNLVGGAVPLQFSLVDLDQTEQIQIEGYKSGVYIAPVLKARSVSANAPIIIHNLNNEQVTAGFSSNKNDFLETSVVDVYFLTAVDKIIIRQTFNAASNGYTLVTNFKAISSVDVVKSTPNGVVTPTVMGTPTKFEVPYTITVANKETLGLNLNNIQVTENLTNPFPSPSATSVTIKPGTLTVNAPAASGISANASFNGVTVFSLLNGTGVLKPNESATINFTAVITYPNAAAVPLTVRNNQVHASGMPFNSASNAGGTYSGANWTSPLNSVSVDSSTNSASAPAIANADAPSPTPLIFDFAALAIHLKEFNAKITQDDQVSLKWTASSDAANDYFVIEKSKDAINWKQISTIASTESLNSDHNYNFTDSNPFTGISYYRLVFNNSNGTINYSNIVSVNLGHLHQEMAKLYPNPAVNNVTIALKNAKAGDKIIYIYNQSGMLLKSYNWAMQSEHEQYTIADIALFPKGTYLVLVKEKGMQIALEKLIKN